MSIVKCHESHYVGVLDNPQLISIGWWDCELRILILKSAMR